MKFDPVQIIGVAAIVAVIIGLWLYVGARAWRQRERNAFADKLARDDAPAGKAFAVYLRPFRFPAYIGLSVDFSVQLRALILSKTTGSDGRNGVKPLERSPGAVASVA